MAYLNDDEYHDLTLLLSQMSKQLVGPASGPHKLPTGGAFESIDRAYAYPAYPKTDEDVLLLGVASLRDGRFANVLTLSDLHRLREAFGNLSPDFAMTSTSNRAWVTRGYNLVDRLIDEVDQYQSRDR